MSVINSAIIVLAAGKGTRMKSARPKVLHELGGKAMLGHVLASAAACAGDKTVAVLAPGMDDVAEYALSHGATHVAYQKEQNGTGDAVKAAEELLSGLDGVAIVVFGDTPLVTPETLIRMKQACAAGNDVVVLGFQAEDPAPYGRLVLNGEGALVKIVEAKDASPEEAAIDLCNGGAMAVRTPSSPTQTMDDCSSWRRPSSSNSVLCSMAIMSWSSGAMPHFSSSFFCFYWCYYFYFFFVIFTSYCRRNNL